MYRALIVLLFLSSIVAANVAVSELAPVSVGFGILAPAGVYLIALTLALRDLVQRFSGPLGLSIAGVGGVLLSFLLADAQVVWASVAAFAVSFAVDTLIFTLGQRKGIPLWRLVLISGLISLVPDTYVFCYLAGFPEFIPGQLLGKAYGTVAYAAVLALSLGRDQKPVSVRSE